MLFKLIHCEVPPADRERFSRAQEAWSALAPLPGFLLQFGGWDAEDPSRAMIFALWESRSAYDVFMCEQHDAIVAASGQGMTYVAIHITLREFEDAGAVDAMLQIARATQADVVQIFKHHMADEPFPQTLDLVRAWTVISETLASKPLADER